MPNTTAIGDQEVRRGAGREQEAYGMPLLPPAELVGRLAEACAIIRSMWTEDEIDFDRDYYALRRARCEPKPIQKPHPVQVHVDMSAPATMVETICALSAAGAGHIALNLMPPYGPVLRSVVDALIAPALRYLRLENSR